MSLIRRFLRLAWFADLHALAPHVLIRVLTASAVPEPGPASAATAELPRLSNDAALGTCGNGRRCLHCWCVGI